MPFGLKVPSKNTLIFSGVAGGIAGLIYTSNKNAQDTRNKLAQRVSFLADRPCGVHVNFFFFHTLLLIALLHCLIGLKIGNAP